MAHRLQNARIAKEQEKLMSINPTDPGAEMKARAYEATSDFANQCPTLREQFADFAAAFAAKEVAAVRVSIKFMGDYSAEELVAYIDSLKQRAEKAEKALAEATTREREELAKAMCSDCADAQPMEGTKHVAFDPDGKKYLYLCAAAAIHSRSQMKGEGRMGKVDVAGRSHLEGKSE